MAPTKKKRKEKKKKKASQANYKTAQFCLTKLNKQHNFNI